MVYAGTSGWAYASWKPAFYPARLSAAKFLNYYASRLNSVEVNYTFRRLPTERILGNWIAATPPGFQFALKAHESITHLRRLREVGEAVANFVASLAPLREAGKLGPVLFQLPPSLPCDLALLDAFLRRLPAALRAAVEFRHASWFQTDVYKLLTRAGVALCQAESPALITPDIATAGFRYFRFRKADYSPTDREALAARIAALPKPMDVFAYFKHEDTPEGAALAEALLQSP